MPIIPIKKKIEGMKHGSHNVKMKSFLIFVVLSYFAFFSSKIWVPDYGKLVESTPYYQKVTYGEYSFYLTQFVYCEEEGVIQVIIEKENRDVKDQELSYTALERSIGNLNVKVAKEESNYVVLRIADTPGWREISLRIQAKGDSNQVKLYTNAKEIDRVASLPELSDTGYQIERLQAQIEYDNARIQEYETKKQKLETENEEIQKRIEELETEVYPTEEEAQNARDLISRARSQKNTNITTIQDHDTEIGYLQERTEQIHSQIEELKRKEG